MANIPEYRQVFKFTLDALEKSELARRDLIDEIVKRFSLSKEEMNDHTLGGRHSELRSLSGSVINDMTAKGIIALTQDGLYRKNETNVIAIRIEECEEEILSLVRSAPRTRNEIKDALVSFFRTDTTATQKDDNKLFTYMGQLLKKLVRDGIFELNGTVYSIAPEKSAYIKNRSEILALKSTFLSRVHARGGEFFEYYFLNLLTRYLTRSGKTVTDSYVTGGSYDGGIDGVVKTVDCLGFRELIMIQTKNRNETMNETDVRGFYGAVCAKQGSRGIFATISDFHPMAIKLLDSIDNCVGIDGDKIFSMACDTSYGIKRDGNRLVIDSELI